MLRKSVQQNARSKVAVSGVDGARYNLEHDAHRKREGD
jgi:hypothetical protein